jgi:hypothetical protein
MKQVGEVYDKLAAYLAAVVAQAQAQDQEQADTSATQEGE